MTKAKKSTTDWLYRIQRLTCLHERTAFIWIKCFEHETEKQTYSRYPTGLVVFSPILKTCVSPHICRLVLCWNKTFYKTQNFCINYCCLMSNNNLNMGGKKIRKTFIKAQSICVCVLKRMYCIVEVNAIWRRIRYLC